MTTRSITPVIGFVDIDSFECQLWLREYPALRGTPCVVANQSQRIVSVTNQAKQLGVSRSTTPFVRNARRVCPTLTVFMKPNSWGKPDATKTRYGTWEILDCIRHFCSHYGDDIIIELASSDEVYIDISAQITRQMEQRMTGRSYNRPLYLPSTIVLEERHKTKPGPFHFKTKLEECDQHLKYIRQDQQRLALGALFMNELCNFLFTKTQLGSAAGVATNKLLAKVGCGINKPGKVTIFHQGAMSRMSKQIPVSSIPGLGGMRCERLKSELHASFVSDLRRLTLDQLEKVFGPNVSQNIFSWARGNDSQPVRHKHMKDCITCNKPTGDIKSMKYFRKTLSELCGEVLSRLEEEKNRHNRTVDSIRLGCTYVTADEQKKSRSEVLCIDERSKLNELPLKALQLIVDQPDFCKSKFTILELKIVAKDFIPMNTDGGSFDESFKAKLLVGPNNELTVNCKTPPSSEFTGYRHIGSFQTTVNQLYSSEDVKIPKLIPSSRLEALKGTYLGERYNDIQVQKSLISDHTEYNELKHRCFIEWLEEVKYTDKVESGKFKKPDFVAFGGRIAETLRSPSAKVYADWELYALNFNNIIYIWDEKKPQVAKPTNLPSFFGIHFERLVSRNEEDMKTVSEYEMMYVVNEVTLDNKHQLLVVSKIDAINEDGDWVEVTVMNNFSDPNFMFERLLKLWAQCAVPGVKDLLIGTKKEGVVQEIKKRSFQELSNQLGDCPAKCTQFLNRFLSFVKSHLPVSDRNTVKKFSWTCGSLKVVCKDVQQQEVTNLIFPRLYTSYLKKLEKTAAAKERANASVA